MIGDIPSTSPPSKAETDTQTDLVTGEEREEDALAGEAGLIPRICHGLLAAAAAATSAEEKEERGREGSSTSVSFSFSVTYVEIFLEKVRDLLLDPPPHSSSTSSISWGSGSDNALRVREHPTEGPFVEGATCAAVTSEAGKWEMKYAHCSLTS